MFGRFLPNKKLEIRFLEWFLHMASWRQGNALPQSLCWQGETEAMGLPLSSEVLL